MRTTDSKNVYYNEKKGNYLLVMRRSGKRFQCERKYYLEAVRLKNEILKKLEAERKEKAKREG